MFYDSDNVNDSGIIKNKEIVHLIFARQTEADHDFSVDHRYVEMNIGLVEQSEDSSEDSDPDLIPSQDSNLSQGKLRLPDHKASPKRPLIEEVGPQ